MIKTHKTKTKHKTLYAEFLFNGFALCNINAGTGTTTLWYYWTDFCTYCRNAER